MTAALDIDADRPPFDCLACAACCAYDETWPRFTLETEDEIAAIPLENIAEDETGMRCEDGRCTALRGVVTIAASCGIYEVRPHVCRDCMPGDPECLEARDAYGMDEGDAPGEGDAPSDDEDGFDADVDGDPDLDDLGDQASDDQDADR